MKATIRRARRSDGPAFLQLVTDLARFERLTPPSAARRRRLLEDAFGPSKKIDVYVAELEGAVVGYAITARTYSSFLARPTLYLEDVYIDPAARKKGVARAMMSHLSRIALDEGCGRIEGVVLDWNRGAQRFYRKTGAKVLPDWRLLRYDERALRRLAKNRTS